MSRFAPTFQKKNNSLVSLWCPQHWQSNRIKLLLAVDRGQQSGGNTPALDMSNTGRLIPAPLLGCTTWTRPARCQEEHSPLSPATTFARHQPECLGEKDAVLCYQHCVEDICCAVQPQPHRIPRPRHKKMQHLNTYIISTCQGLSSHLLEGNKFTLMRF